MFIGYESIRSTYVLLITCVGKLSYKTLQIINCFKFQNILGYIWEMWSYCGCFMCLVDHTTGFFHNHYQTYCLLLVVAHWSLSLLIRDNYVKYKGFHLPIFISTSRVPQGSNLGPFLFSYFHWFAILKYNFCVQMNSLKTIFEWCKMNYLRANVEKCFVVTSERNTRKYFYTELMIWSCRDV